MTPVDEFSVPYVSTAQMIEVDRANPFPGHPGHHDSGAAQNRLYIAGGQSVDRRTLPGRYRRPPDLYAAPPSASRSGRYSPKKRSCGCGSPPPPRSGTRIGAVNIPPLGPSLLQSDPELTETKPHFPRRENTQESYSSPWPKSSPSPNYYAENGPDFFPPLHDCHANRELK